MIIETQNNRDTAIVYYKAEDIECFREGSGKLANKNEYQCHYDALVMITEFSDGSKHYDIFPLTYYNYPQKVGGASIDFEMKDVIAMSEKCNEVTMAGYKLLKDKLKALYPERKFQLTRFSNIHKHP